MSQSEVQQCGGSGASGSAASHGAAHLEVKPAPGVHVHCEMPQDGYWVGIP